MIRYFSYRPEYFNNNGDQGNLAALSHFTRQPLEPVTIEEADLVLFGDASRAAMREFKAELDGYQEILASRAEIGAPTLLIGSCFEFFSGTLEALPKPKYGKRVSEFREISDAGLSIKGYRNSELVSQDFYRLGAFVGTTLFGPVLAKNLGLAKIFADSLGLELLVSEREREWISKL